MKLYFGAFVKLSTGLLCAWSVSVAAAADVGSQVDAVVRTRVLDAEHTPASVRRLAERRLSEYLPSDVSLTRTQIDVARRALGADASRVLNYFDRNAHDPAATERTRHALVNTAAHLDPGAADLSQTVEEFVAAEHVHEIERSPDPEQSLWEVLKGPRLDGASPHVAVRLSSWLSDRVGPTVVRMRDSSVGKMLPAGVLVGSTVLTMWVSRRFLKSTFLSGFLIGAIQAGPMAAILNASYSWLLDPATEFIQVLNSKYTGDAKQSIHSALDKMNSQTGQPGRTGMVNYASLDKDSSNIAGWSLENMDHNWVKLREMYLSAAKSWGQLLRDEQHHGRGLLIMLWEGERDTAHQVMSLRGQIKTYDTNDEVILNPYRAAFIGRGETQRNDDLTRRLRALQDLIGQHHARPGLTPADPARLARARAELADLGVAEAVIDVLVANQRERARARTIIVGILALNEMRFFMYAEGNRNQESSGRELNRGAREALMLQEFVEEYRVEIQDVHRAMGMDVDAVQVDSRAG